MTEYNIIPLSETTITLPPVFDQQVYTINNKFLEDIKIVAPRSWRNKWVITKKSEHVTECKCVKTLIGKLVDWVKR